MLKKIALAAVFLLILPLAALADSVRMGTTEDGITIFLDTDIKPVAYVDKDGARVIASGIFTENYLLYKNARQVTINSMYDTQARRTFEMAADTDDWRDYPEGGDGLLFGAYVVRDYAKIMSGRPFMLKKQFLPRTRSPLWPVDANGWQKVYERKDGSKAWVQTKSAVLSYTEEEQLPHVRVLIRRLEAYKGGEPEIMFTYESYDPEKRTKQILKMWDKDLKEIAADAETLYPVPILSGDAAIASLGYAVFILDYEQTKHRVLFTVGEEPLFIRESWFEF